MFAKNASSILHKAEYFCQDKMCYVQSLINSKKFKYNKQILNIPWKVSYLSYDKQYGKMYYGIWVKKMSLPIRFIKIMVNLHLVIEINCTWIIHLFLFKNFQWLTTEYSTAIASESYFKNSSNFENYKVSLSSFYSHNSRLVLW